MVARLAQWHRGAGFAAIRAEWLSHAAGIGGDIVVRLPDRELCGKFETLDRMGRLMLRLPAGKLEAITAGEVFAQGVVARPQGWLRARRAWLRARRARPMARGSELLFAPLGGVGEIGMNLALYGLGDGGKRTWMAVDLGVAFAGDDLPGVDLIMPDIAFLMEQRRNLAGLVLTHAHEDHFGALMDLWPRLRCPVYATPFTAALFEAKRLSEPGAPDMPIKVVPLGSRFHVGPFDVELVSVSHSIPESNALIIRTPLGNVLHTGDWKLDPTPIIGPPTDEAKLKALGEEGCLALIGDSTNAVREGRSPSEADVARTLRELIAGATGRVAVTTFASNVARMRAVAEAAAAAGREVVVVGRAMVARRAGRARDRLSRRHRGFPQRRGLRLPAARQGRGAVHRQPGRAARRARAHLRGPAPGGDALARATS